MRPFYPTSPRSSSRLVKTPVIPSSIITPLRVYQLSSGELFLNFACVIVTYQLTFCDWPRFITAGTPSTLPEFEAALFPPFHAILQHDISEFTPFVFQILSQLLELHPPNSLPDLYSVLLPPLLTPTLWESRGNVPALVRLLRAFMERGSAEIVRDGKVAGLLGVFQHLIKSKANDSFGFELLESLIEFIPL